VIPVRGPGLAAASVVWLLAAAPAGAAAWTVEVFADGFSPATLALAPGDTVTWVNRSPVPHEMAFDADPTGAGRSDPRWLLRADPVTLRVARPGRYPYRCNWHGIYGVLDVRAPAPGG
jgi:plastocyanin